MYLCIKGVLVCFKINCHGIFYLEIPISRLFLGYFIYFLQVFFRGIKRILIKDNNSSHFLSSIIYYLTQMSGYDKENTP